MTEHDWIILAGYVRIVSYTVLFILFNIGASIHHGVRRVFYIGISLTLLTLAFTNWTSLYAVNRFELTRFILTPLLAFTALLGIATTLQKTKRRHGKH